MTDNSPLSALRSGWRIFREKGARRAAREGFFYGYESLFRTYCSLSGGNRGENVYDRDWDVLLILDACRVDLLHEVAGEYDFVGEIDRLWSVGSASAEWMDHTFTDDYRAEVADTVYVTGNPFSESRLDPDRFGEVHEVWKTHWDDEVGTVRPRPLTDRAVDRWRNADHDRLIVHYMQPHYPFVEASLPGRGLSAEKWGDVNETNVWYQLRDGELDHDDVWAAYRDNLRHVLEDVALFLDVVDADRVAITADHGNAVGERGIYGHPRRVCLPALREVPWVETTAERVREYEPSLETDADGPDDDGDAVEDRLTALGYK